MDTSSRPANRASESRALKVLALGIVATAVILAVAGWQCWSMLRDTGRTVADSLRLQELRGIILHYDEVLTMSARMAAATGDLSWERRYRQFEPALDAAIKDAIAHVSTCPGCAEAARTDQANQNLVAMQDRAFGLIRQGRRAEAADLLSSAAYQKEKAAYAEGMAALDDDLAAHLGERLEAYRGKTLRTGLLGATAVVVFVAGWCAVFAVVRTHFKKRLAAEAAMARAQQDLESIIDERTQDLAATNQELRAEIEERQEIERTLRDREEMFRSITTSAQDAIIMLDADGNISHWNPAAEAIFGYTRAEAFGKYLHTFLAPQRFRAAHFQAFPRFQETGQGTAVGQTLRLAGIRKNGQEFPFELSLSAVKMKGAWHAIGIVRDITEQEKAEQVLAETLNHQVEMNQLRQELLGPGELPEKLSKITAAAVRMWDLDFCRVWVTKPGDLCASGCVHAEVTEGPHVCKYRDQCLHLLASSGRYTHTDGKVHRRVPFGCYKIGRVASGDDRKFLTNDVVTDPRVHNHEWAKELGLVSFAGYQLRPPGGQTLGVLALFSKHVITPEIDAMLESLAHTAARVIMNAAAGEHQKNLQSQLLQSQRLESIGQLAAGIAHEINTPIQYVGDNTRFLQDSVQDLLKIVESHVALLDPDQGQRSWAERRAEVEATLRDCDVEFLREEIPKAIEQTLEGVGRVAKIVRSMKEFSHPGGDTKQPADLNQAIETTITVARNEWKYVANMVTDLDAALPPVPCLLGDFNQVILNTIINAAHAIANKVDRTRGEKGTITVSTRPDGAWVEIRISDTGTGIPEEIRSKVFDPFFTTKEVGKGTGQGLAIARATVVNKHGGDIRLESEVGQGTTFIIRLPLETKPEAAPADGSMAQPALILDSDTPAEGGGMVCSLAGLGDAP